MSLLRFACCCALLLSNFSTTGAAEEPLLWKFAPGDEHHYRMSQTMEMEMSMGDVVKKISTTVDQTMEMLWKVEQVDDQGRAKITQKISRMQMDMQAPGQQEMHYDTNSDEAPTGYGAMIAPLFKAMTAEPFTMTMTTRGQMEDIEMPESFLKALKAIPGAAMMGDMFSDDGFKKMMQKNSLILPKPEDLELGHEWTTKSEMKNAQLGKIATEVTYRYLGPREIEGKTFEVFGIGLNMEFGEGAGGTQIKISNQQSNGEILFDREAGRLESTTMQQEMEMLISVGKQEMSQTMVQKILFQRVEPTETKDDPAAE